jgi:hypothetical protein
MALLVEDPGCPCADPPVSDDNKRHTIP